MYACPNVCLSKETICMKNDECLAEKAVAGFENTAERMQNERSEKR